MSTLIDAEKLLKVIRDMGSDELLNQDEIAELVKTQPVAYRDIYEDGYIPPETCDTCKHGYFGDMQCDNCCVRYPSHYERRTDG